MGCRLCKTKRSRVAPLPSSQDGVVKTAIASSRSDEHVRLGRPPVSLQDNFELTETRFATVRTGSRSSSESAQLTSTKSSEAGRRTPSGKSRVGDKTDRKAVIDLLGAWRENGMLDDINNAVATVEETSLEKLSKRLAAKNVEYIASLKGAPSFHKELAKAYALFCWITNHVQYDYNCLDVLESGGLSDDDTSPAIVLRTKRTICSGYSRLFVTLSDRMGLSAKYISGHFKSLKATQLLSTVYQPFSPDKSNSHAWNMVCFWLGIACLLYMLRFVYENTFVQYCYIIFTINVCT